jgi:hypothetical protein
VLGTSVIRPFAYQSEFQEQVCKLLESSASLPEQILVSKPEVQELIEPIAAKLGIKLKVVKRLKTLEEARDSLLDHLLG